MAISVVLGLSHQRPLRGLNCIGERGSAHNFGDDLGQHTSAEVSGRCHILKYVNFSRATYLYLATGQIQFLDSRTGLRSQRRAISPVVFSETMRDGDLFVAGSWYRERPYLETTAGSGSRGILGSIFVWRALGVGSAAH